MLFEKVHAGYPCWSEHKGQCGALDIILNDWKTIQSRTELNPWPGNSKFLLSYINEQ